MIRQPTRSTLFPCTSLFRSNILNNGSGKVTLNISGPSSATSGEGIVVHQKSTGLNFSHANISYAAFSAKKNRNDIHAHSVTALVHDVRTHAIKCGITINMSA